MTFGSASHVVFSLHSLDYGGLTTVTATRDTAIATLKLPVDTNANWLADAGWNAGSAHIADTGLAKDVDEDNDPAVSATAPPSLGKIGDGLVNYEEYRGFVRRAAS